MLSSRFTKQLHAIVAVCNRILIVGLVVWALPACTNSLMTDHPEDAAADRRAATDLLASASDAPADASADSHTEATAEAGADVAPGVAPDAGTVPETMAGSQPEIGANLESRPANAVDAGAPVDGAASADASVASQREAGVTPDVGVIREEVGTPSSASLVITPTIVNLGTLELGRSANATVVVTNTGAASSGAIVLNPSVGVTVVGCAGVLAPQTSCILTILVTPVALGAFSGTVSITANPGTVVPLITSFTGVVGQTGQFAVSPALIDLGNVPVGARMQQTITVTALTAISDLTVGLLGMDVTRDPTSTCTEIMATGVSCAVVVNFAAISPGPKSDSVVITAGGRAVAVPVTATAQAPAKLVMSQPSAAFVATANAASSPVTIAVANAGDVPTGTLTVSMAGANHADFKLTTSGCTLLAPLATCAVSVVFTPSATSAGTETATLTVTDSGPGASTVSAILTGTVYSSPMLTITSAQSDLGSVAVGATGAVTVFTISNTADPPSGALTVSASSPEFVITNDTCTTLSLAKGGSCTLSLALKPTIVGAKSAVLTASGTSGNPVAKSITGSGI
jgi:hypothetical protein